MPQPCIQLYYWILQLHYVSYSSMILSYLQQVHNTQKLIVHRWVSLLSQHMDK